MNVLHSFDNFFFLELSVFAILGLAFGSFASALMHRIPQGKGALNMKSRSACPHCGGVLKPRDLIPLLSWVLSKGRCRMCGEKISALYPALEITACLVALALFFFYQGTGLVERVVVLFTVPILLSLFVIDLRHKILPNVLVLALFVLGLCRLAVVAWFDAETGYKMAIDSALAAVMYAAIAWAMAFVMEKILKKPALGMGDVKFFAVAGLWLGIGNLGAFCILAGVLGVILGIIWQKTYKEAAFPFGPALIASFFILLCL